MPARRLGACFKSGLRLYADSRAMNPAEPRQLPAAPFKTLIDSNIRLKVVDIGANPLDDGPPPYAGLLKAGDVDLVVFEPHAPSLDELNRRKGPFETYLPQAVGDGRRHTLRICHAPGLSSVLAPNPPVMRLFHLFPVWSRVFSTQDVDTVRLDDVPETAGADFIKMDIQGGELMAFGGAINRLREVAVIQTEVSFLPLYEGQPLFSEIEIFLRQQGFMFHRFFPIASRLISPFLLDNGLYAGFSQEMQADAVFVRDFTRQELLTDRQLMVTAIIMHDCYRSFDAALFQLLELDRRNNTKLGSQYMEALQPYFPDQVVWMWKGPVKGPPTAAKP